MLGRVGTEGRNQPAATVSPPPCWSRLCLLLAPPPTSQCPPVKQPIPGLTWVPATLRTAKLGGEKGGEKAEREEGGKGEKRE